jgi:hypothetical protein
MKDEELIWQTRYEYPVTTNRSEDKMIAFLYGGDSINSLKIKHNWNDEDVQLIQKWHNDYNVAWNLFVKNKDE